MAGGDRSCYKRTAFLPADKNGKKPKKVIGEDGKLIEPEPDKYATRALADRILAGEDVTDSQQGAIQDIFYLAPSFPRSRLG